MRGDENYRPDVIFDVVTGEAITISPYLGIFQFSENEYLLDGPSISIYQNKTASEAISFYENFYLAEKETMNIIQDKTGVQTLWGFSMIP